MELGNGAGTMSYKEADRVGLIRAVVEKRLRQREAAKRLGIGVRQVKRLVRRYRSDGPTGLVSGHRGKRPNNAIGEGVRREVLALVRKRYADFGPTLAWEKLVEVHGHRLSAETLRQWMMAEGLWRSKARRAVRVHPRRPRRACVGDLVQIDGSPRDWFEGRGPPCTLIVYVDDATTRLMAAGNAYLPEFMADFNGRFAVAPRDPADAHRKVLHETRELDLIFSEHHVRKLTKNLSIRFQCREYQVTGRGQGYRLRGAAVTVCEAFDGSVTVLHKGRELAVRQLAEGEEAVAVEDEKTVRRRVDRAKAEQQSRPAYKPAPDHPWRRALKPGATSVAAG